MDERPIDLTPLDPTLDREHWERRIAAIAALTAPELSRRAAAAESPLQVLVGWFRPDFSAAALLALCAGGALLLLLPAGAPEPAAAIDALRLPAPVALWLGDDAQPPTVADLALAVQEGEP
jgi:hypothetical protein